MFCCQRFWYWESFFWVCVSHHLTFMKAGSIAAVLITVLPEILGTFNAVLCFNVRLIGVLWVKITTVCLEKTCLEACKVTQRCGLPRQEVLGGKINQRESLAGAANAIWLANQHKRSLVSSKLRRGLDYYHLHYDIASLAVGKGSFVEE